MLALLNIPPALQAVFTLLILIILAVLIFVLRGIINARKDTIKARSLVVIYSLLFVLIAAAALGLLLIWGYDIEMFFDGLSTDFVSNIERRVGSIISSLVTIFIALLIYKSVKIGLYRVGKKEGIGQRRKKTIAKITTSIVKYTVGIVALLIVFASWGVNIAPALAGLGVLGLIIGLGAQKFINDLISGLFIIFEHHFDVGDRIEVKGFTGEVIDIGLKTTKIRNWKGEVKILSNGDINDITNFSWALSVAVVEFGIAYKEDARSEIDLLNQELPKLRLEIEEIVEDPVVLGVTELANSSVNLRVIAKTINGQHFAVERKMRLRIKEILDENGIEIPFPQVVVHSPNPKKQINSLKG